MGLTAGLTPAVSAAETGKVSPGERSVMHNYLSYIVYALFLLSILLVAKYAGKNKFHEDSAGLDATLPLRGIAAMGVVFHHISQETQFQRAAEMSLFVNVGFLFVAIFMFFSGYGLIKSMDSKPDYMKGFLRKRLPVIIVPYYVSILFCTVLALIRHAHFEPVQWVTNSLGLTMINEYAWYPIVLTFLYIAFYLTFGRIKNRRTCLAIMFGVVVLFGVIFAFNGHFVWWIGEDNWWMNFRHKPEWWQEQKVFWFSGEWWVNSAIAFWTGLFFACKEDKIRAEFEKSYSFWLVICVLMLMITGAASTVLEITVGYWSEFGGQGPGIINKLICFIGQMPLVISFVILIYVILMKVKTGNPVTRFLGKISLETYMMNYVALQITTDIRMWMRSNARQFPAFKMISDNSEASGRFTYFLLVVVITLLLALLYRAVNRAIIKRICKVNSRNR